MVEFENGDALLVVDVLADFDHEDSESLLASFRERGAAMASAIAAARGAGVPVVYSTTIAAAGTATRRRSRERNGGAGR